jgi:hypothetical protein
MGEPLSLSCQEGCGGEFELEVIVCFFQCGDNGGGSSSNGGGSLFVLVYA